MQEKLLKLRGRAIVFVDWANVYRWRDSLKREVDSVRLYKCMNEYCEVAQMGIYHGQDENEKSKNFLEKMRNVGYQVVTKPVKYLRMRLSNGEEILQRKGDFDLEIGLDVYERLDEYQTFIFFSGDGDYATLYERLIAKHKQVIVVYAAMHLGREVWQIKKGLFKIEIDRLCPLALIKNVPRAVKPRGEIRPSVTQKSRKSK